MTSELIVAAPFLEHISCKHGNGVHVEVYSGNISGNISSHHSAKEVEMLGNILMISYFSGIRKKAYNNTTKMTWRAAHPLKGKCQSQLTLSLPQPLITN